MGMLEGQMQGGFLRVGLARERVGTVVGKAIWDRPVDSLEMWIEKFGFDFVHIEELSRAFEQENNMLEKCCSRTI